MLVVGGSLEQGLGAQLVCTTQNNMAVPQAVFKNDLCLLGLIGSQLCMIGSLPSGSMYPS